jgi:hypothetical protein
MSLKIEVRGINNIKDSLNEEFRGFVERIMDEVKAEIPKFTPKDTGRARNGWLRKGQGINSTVENPVPYVQYLEKPYVKSKQAPQGIIGPTLTSIKGKIK